MLGIPPFCLLLSHPDCFPVLSLPTDPCPAPHSPFPTPRSTVKRPFSATTRRIFVLRTRSTRKAPSFSPQLFPNQENSAIGSFSPPPCFHTSPKPSASRRRAGFLFFPQIFPCCFSTPCLPHDSNLPHAPFPSREKELLPSPRKVFRVLLLLFSRPFSFYFVLLPLKIPKRF